VGLPFKLLAAEQMTIGLRQIRKLRKIMGGDEVE